jgi:hypothetical protein
MTHAWNVARDLTRLLLSAPPPLVRARTHTQRERERERETRECMHRSLPLGPSPSRLPRFAYRVECIGNTWFRRRADKENMLSEAHTLASCRCTLKTSLQCMPMGNL